MVFVGETTARCACDAIYIANEVVDFGAYIYVLNEQLNDVISFNDVDNRNCVEFIVLC